ncbi:hypothetical protein ACIHFE_14070 [Streptomyces sp. NPDC052396]|uniref:hypothetical protein n=1 Tax=Streptomyces sp. NPDC052396 TaxID=3365689 RepID=UPI0037D7C5AA
MTNSPNNKRRLASRELDQSELRLLPWSKPDGEPCYLSQSNFSSPLVRIADEVEAAQTRCGADVLAGAKAVLEDPNAGSAQLRYALVRAVESLGEVLRVAKSRGARLRSRPRDEANPDAHDSAGDQPPAEDPGNHYGQILEDMPGNPSSRPAGNTETADMADTPPMYATGALVVDKRDGRVGKVMDTLDGVVHLRPLNGGREWPCLPNDIRIATDDEVRRARPCGECRRIKAERLEALEQGDHSAAEALTTLMGRHLREVHP